MGWPGFFHAAPEVQNTARNTDGFWVIHGGASRDTNKLLQDVAPLLATDLRRTFTPLCSCYTCAVRAGGDVKRRRRTWFCTRVILCSNVPVRPPRFKRLTAIQAYQRINQPEDRKLNSSHVQAASLISWFSRSAEE